jgi:hypothetical protein
MSQSSNVTENDVKRQIAILNHLLRSFHEKQDVLSDEKMTLQWTCAVLGELVSFIHH